MKELKFTITGTMFVPDDVEYEYNFENQIYILKIKDKNYVLLAGLEAEDDNGIECLITDEHLRKHNISIDSYDDAFFED